MRDSRDPQLDFAVCEEIRNEANVKGLNMIKKGEVIRIEILPIMATPNIRLVEEISSHLAKIFPNFVDVFREAVDRSSVLNEGMGIPTPLALAFRYLNPHDLKTFESGFQPRRLGPQNREGNPEDRR